MVSVLVVEDRRKKSQNGLKQLIKERVKSLKDYQIDCEECYETSYVAAYKKPKYCPNCGRRAEVEEIENDE